MAIKKGVKLAIFLLVLILLTTSVIAPPEKTTSGGSGEEKFPTEDPNQERLEQQLEQQIQSSISTGSTVNLDSPEYKQNPEVVKDVLKKKHGLEINDFTGAKIEGGILKTGNNQIDLQTGKRIQVNVQGNTIKRYDDGETKILNANGVTITPSAKEIQQAERINDRETDVHFLQNYKATQDTTTIQAATLVAVEDNIINHANSITIKKTNNKLTHVSYKSTSDNNEATINNIQIITNKDREVQADLTLTTTALTMDKGTKISHNNIKAIADESGATFTLRKRDQETEIETKFTTTTFETHTLKETLIAKTTSKARISDNHGFYEIELGINSRFSQINKQEEKKSFFFLNTGNDDIQAFIVKPGHRLFEEEIPTYDFYARTEVDMFIFKGNIDWGIYQDQLPFVIIESTNKNNKINLIEGNLKLNYQCEEETKLASLHTNIFNIIDVCKDNNINRFAGYETENPDFLKKITTNTKPTITITNGVLLQIDNNDHVLRMFSNKEPFLNTLKNYNDAFKACKNWENHLSEKQTIQEWLTQ